jgi:tetratricopeptide (TPR) repeat protein
LTPISAGDDAARSRAIGHLELALVSKPEFDVARCELCRLMFEAGRREAARATILAGIERNPSCADFHFYLGNLYAEDGEEDKAAACYRTALAWRPDHLPALRNLGKMHRKAGRLDDAEASFRHALAAAPNDAESHHDLALVLQTGGKAEAAIPFFERAIALAPDNAGPHNTLGLALQQLGRLDAAEARYRSALQRAPDSPDAHYNLGNALKEQDRLDDAAACYRTALSLRPDFIEAHNNLGSTLQAQGRLDDAIRSYREALAVAPDCAEAHHNLGLAFQDRGDLDSALRSYRRALETRPDFAEAHWNESLCLLLRAEFEQGWRKYEWRWKNPQLKKPKPNFDKPLWLGEEPLAGKTLLLHAEQGFGDAIQFCRYARLAAERGATVVLETPAPLKGLLSQVAGIASVRTRDDPLPDFDFYCPILSLPLAFGTRLDNIPDDVPYVCADPARATAWRERLGTARGLRVGLVWSGNPGHANDRNRSISFAAAAKLLTGDAQFVSLQKDVRAADKAMLDASDRILNFESDLKDFQDTAALVANMDLVITVDTSVAHLAGAMGKPVWILLPFNPDWRWMIGRTDSPWYPSARLFRQPAPGDWAGVLASVTKALREMTESYVRPA